MKKKEGEGLFPRLAQYLQKHIVKATDTVGKSLQNPPSVPFETLLSWSGKPKGPNYYLAPGLYLPFGLIPSWDSAIFLLIFSGKILKETLQSGQGLRFFNCCENILEPLFPGFHWPHWKDLVPIGYNHHKNLFFHFWNIRWHSHVSGSVLTLCTPLSRHVLDEWAASLWKKSCAPSFGGL